MNRRLGSAAVFVLAVAAFAVSEAGAQQVVAPAGRNIEATWQAERAFYVSKTMERARAQVANRRFMVEIGTLGAEDTTRSVTALADLEALVTADAKRTDRPARSLRDIAAIRTALADALNRLDASEVRFDNGLITSYELDAAYRAVIRVLLS